MTPSAGLQADAGQLISLLELAVYTLMQLGRLASASYPYQLAKVSGSFLMTIVAPINRDYGFILMEGVWFLTPPRACGGWSAAAGGCRAPEGALKDLLWCVRPWRPMTARLAA